MSEDFNNDSDSRNDSSNCWRFWLANSLLSFVNGCFGRSAKEDEAAKDKEFQEQMTALKYSHEDAKEAMEYDFKRKMAELQRENRLIQKEFEQDFALQKHEIKMFIQGWPLDRSLQSIQEQRELTSQIPQSLYVVIAKHTGNKGKKSDTLADLYDENGHIVENVIAELEHLNIPARNILRFKKEDKPGGGAALANIYSVMSNVPTIVILPRLDRLNKKLRISIGCWSPCSTTPSQRMIFLLDYDEEKMMSLVNYRKSKQKEIETAYISIAGVMNDMYRLSLFGEKPCFPTYAETNSISLKFPQIGDFIQREYKALTDKQSDLMNIDGHEIDMKDMLSF